MTNINDIPGDSSSSCPNNDCDLTNLHKKIVILELENQRLNALISVLKEERNVQDAAYISYIEELEGKINDTVVSPPPPSVLGEGKALSLSVHKIRNIITLYISGNSIKLICKETSCSRGQVERIIKGKLMHRKSRCKVQRVISQLIETQSEEEAVCKLNVLKELYSKNI